MKCFTVGNSNVHCVICCAQHRPFSAPLARQHNTGLDHEVELGEQVYSGLASRVSTHLLEQCFLLYTTYDINRSSNNDTNRSSTRSSRIVSEYHIRYITTSGSQLHPQVTWVMHRLLRGFVPVILAFGKKYNTGFINSRRYWNSLAGFILRPLFPDMPHTPDIFTFLGVLYFKFMGIEWFVFLYFKTYPVLSNNT